MKKDAEIDRRNVSIDGNLADELKIIAIKKGITLREYCNALAVKAIKEEKKKKKK